MEAVGKTSIQKSKLMRLKEFKLDERQYLKEKYPHLTEEQLDEILPALGAIGAGALGAAKVAGTALAKGAMAAGRVGAKMGTAALKGAGKLAVKGAKGAGNLAVQGAKAGAKAGYGAAKNVGKNVAKAGMDIAGDMADKAATKMLKVGSQLPVGGQAVKVDKLQGDEVTFADPKNPNAPKTVVKKNSPIVKSALNDLIPR
jgi:hypothetical protein